jgi:hypothetical protein
VQSHAICLMTFDRPQFGCASMLPRINCATAISTPVGQNAPCRLCFEPASDPGYAGSTDPRTQTLAWRARCPAPTAELVVARCAITAPGPRSAPRSVADRVGGASPPRPMDHGWLGAVATSRRSAGRCPGSISTKCAGPIKLFARRAASAACNVSQVGTLN